MGGKELRVEQKTRVIAVFCHLNPLGIVTSADLEGQKLWSAVLLCIRVSAFITFLFCRWGPKRSCGLGRQDPDEIPHRVNAVYLEGVSLPTPREVH